MRNLDVRELRRVVDDVEYGVIGRNLDDRPIGKDLLEPALEAAPVARAEEAVEIDEAAAQQVLAERRGLLLAQSPVAGEAGDEEGASSKCRLRRPD